MEIYQHFRKEEHAFIDQVLSWKEEVERSYQRKLTDFLDPREQQIVDMLVGTENDDLQVNQFGGGHYSERKRAIIAPYYEEIEHIDYQLTLLEGNYHSKFITLTHRDIMGSFLSLGVTRQTLGDIYLKDGRFQIITTTEISPFIKTNLTSIKNATIQLVDKPFDDLIETEKNWVEQSKTISSLRLDNVLKEIYNLSRKDAVDYIKKNNVKVNFKVVDEPSFQLRESDMLSLRGKGRSKLISLEGKTRKNRLRAIIAILK